MKCVCRHVTFRGNVTITLNHCYGLKQGLYHVAYFLYNFMSCWMFILFHVTITIAYTICFVKIIINLLNTEDHRRAFKKTRF